MFTFIYNCLCIWCYLYNRLHLPIYTGLHVRYVNTIIFKVWSLFYVHYITHIFPVLFTFVYTYLKLFFTRRICHFLKTTKIFDELLNDDALAGIAPKGRTGFWTFYRLFISMYTRRMGYAYTQVSAQQGVHKVVQWPWQRQIWLVHPSQKLNVRARRCPNGKEYFIFSTCWMLGLPILRTI